MLGGCKIAKESKYVKKITNREVKLFKQLSRTGLTDRTQASIFCNLNNKRLEKLQNSGYIRKTNYCVNGKNTEIIRLDKEGIKYCKKHLGAKQIASAQTNHLEHDLKLSLTYYSLPPEVQETWEHEREILGDIYKQFRFDERLKTCIDARVTINGITTAIEVIGNSYRQADLDLKEEIALNYANCSSIEFIK